MTDPNKKYRRFGIGALIVLGVVILIAIIVIANTVNKTPKASNGDGPVVTTTEQPKKEEKKETKKEETKKETTGETPVVQTPVSNTESMPTTGPEDYILPIVLVATSAYLVALNVSWAKRDTKSE